MAKGKGGPFFTLITHQIRFSEFAFNNGDYENCMSHLQSLGNLLNVELQSPPYGNSQALTVQGGGLWKKQRYWILRNRPKIAKAVRDWMDMHAKNGIDVLDDDSDDEEGPEK